MNTAAPVLMANVSVEKIRICPRWDMLFGTKDRLSSKSNTNPTVLGRLVRRMDDFEQVRLEKKACAEAAGLNSRVNRAMSEDASVRYAIAEDHSSSAVLLEALAEDADKDVQDRAQRTIALLKAEQTLLGDQGRL